MSFVAPRKRRLSNSSEDDDSSWQTSTRVRFSPSGGSTGTATTTHTVPPHTFPAFPFVPFAASLNTQQAPILPRMAYIPMLPPSFASQMLPFQPPPPAQGQFALASAASSAVLNNSAQPYLPRPLLPTTANLASFPLHSRSPRSAYTDEVILVDDDDDMSGGDSDLARAIAASMADVRPRPNAAVAVSSVDLRTPPSPSNSVISLDVDDDECQSIDPFACSSHSPVWSSVAHLPLSPSRWASLPVDLLALISTFQFSGRRAVSASGAAEEDEVLNTAMRLAGQYAHPASSSSGQSANAAQPDDAVLSIRLLLNMSVVCRHWNGAVCPPIDHRLHSRGFRDVDCWSGVQQLVIKQSGRHIHVGGVRVKRKRIATVLASLSCLRAVSLEFNIDQSAFDDSDFDLLLPGGTVTGAYPKLQHLTVRLTQSYVPPKPRSKAHKPHHHPQPQQPPQQVLYAALSSWLLCHPKLRSFALIDPHATTPLPPPPIFFPMPPPMPVRAPRIQLARRAGRRRAANQPAAAAQPVVQPQPIPVPNMGPQLAAFRGAFLAFRQFGGIMPPGALQPAAYRPPPIPQPTVAALRLLCTGRLQHMALGGETLVRLAYGDDEANDEKQQGMDADEGSARCFRVNEVASVTLVGNYTQPRYIDALYNALPSLTHLTISSSQSSTGAEQLLAKVGPRITFIRSNITSLAGLAQPSVCVNCSALQSLFLHIYHVGTELTTVYAALPSLPSLLQLTVVEHQPPGSQRYPVLHNLPEQLLPPLPNLLYLHLQISSYRVFPLVASRNAQPSTILPAKLTHLLLSVPGQQLVPHLSSVPLLCPKLTHCHISSGASVTSQTWEARLGRLKGRLGRVWCGSAGEVLRHRMDVAWRASAGVMCGSGSGADEWEGALM